MGKSVFKKATVLSLVIFATLVASMFILASGHLIVGLIMIGAITLLALSSVVSCAVLYNELKEEE